MEHYIHSWKNWTSYLEKTNAESKMNTSREEKNPFENFGFHKAFLKNPSDIYLNFEPLRKMSLPNTCYNLRKTMVIHETLKTQTMNIWTVWGL